MSNIIDKIQVSGVTYDIQGSGGGITIDPTLDSGSTNPVQNQALYDELRIVDESATLLEWEQYDGGESTNYPSGCTKITVEVDENEMTYGAYTLYNNNYDCFGVFNIESNGGVITVSTADCESEPTTSITYSISDNVVTIEYPTITNVTIIGTAYDNYWTIKAIGESVTPLINQVTANTVSIQGKQDTLSAGTNITINGNVISAEGGGGNPTVELTQAQYDALVTAGTVSADTYYIITDAQAGDLTQYWTSAQTQSAINQAVSGKQDTLVSGTNIKTINNTSILGSGNIDIQGGGGSGKAIEAGTNISVTTGATADTINCTLPISAGTNSSGKGIIVGDNECSASGLYGVAIGHNVDANLNYSFVMGSNSSSRYNNGYSFTFGDGCNNEGEYSFMFGRGGTQAKTTKPFQFYFGSMLHFNNDYEVSFGTYNNSVSGSSTFGNSGNTMFTIGNGYDFSSTHNWHNAFEIRQNGDIYVPNTNDTSVTGDYAYSLYPMLKLQDYMQLKLVKITAADYAQITPDENTVYFVGDSNGYIIKLGSASVTM